MILNKRTFLNNPKKQEIVKSYLENGSQQEIIELFDLVYSQNITRSLIFNENSLFPKKIELLRSTKNFVAPNWVQDLRWQTAYLHQYPKQLNYYLDRKNEFSEKFLLGDFASARVILEDVKKELGFSIWSLEQEIILTQKEFGIAAQKAFVKLTQESNTIDSFLRGYLYLISLRSEDEYSVTLFHKTLYSSATDENTKNFLNYLLDFSEAHSIQNFDHFWSLSHQNCFIDIYENYVKMLSLKISKEAYEYEKNETCKSLEYLLPKISSNNLLNIYILSGGKKIFQQKNLSSEFNKIIDSYTKSKYEESLELAKTHLLKNPAKSENYEILIKSFIYTNPNHIKTFDVFLKSIIKEHSPLFEIIKSYYHFISNGPEIKTSLQILSKHIKSNPSHDWVFSLEYQIKKYIEDSSNIKVYSVLKSIHDSTLNPRVILESHDKSIIETYNDYSNSIKAPDETRKMFQCIEAVKDEIEAKDERSIIFKALILKKKGLKDESIDLLNSHLSSFSFLGKSKAKEMLCDLYIEKKNILECAKLIIDDYLFNEDIYFKLPISRTIKTIETNEGLEDIIKNKIETPIIYDIYAKKIASNKEDKKRHYFETFLFENNYKKPSEISTSEFPDKIYKYFLHSVCTPQVMRSNYNLPTKKSRIQERINICSILNYIDPTNSKKYSQEIIDLSLELKTKELIHKIEKSKIQINLSVIREICRQELAEQFIRYKNIREKALDDAYASSKNKIYKSNEIPLVIKSNREQFTEIITFIEKTYVSGDKHSLNGILSSTVRHGAMATQLRLPFENHHVITKKNDLNEYSTNEYFLKSLKTSNPELAQKTDFVLKKFSKSIDDLIKQIWNEWIRIYNPGTHPKGLFHISIKDMAMPLSVLIKKDTTFDQFFDITIDYLSNEMVASLAEVRNELKTTAKKEFRSLIETCLEELRNIETSDVITTITNEISASATEIQVTLEKLTEWFHLPEKDDFEDTNTSFVIQLGLAAVKQLHPSLNIQIEFSESEDVKVQGMNIRALYEIIIILFDNAAKYSQIENNNLTIKVSITYLAETLRIQVSNKVQRVSGFTQIKQAIQSINQYASNLHDFSGANEEGKSGYKKIKRSLAVDLGRSFYKIQCFIDEQNAEFTASIQMDAIGL